MKDDFDTPTAIYHLLTLLTSTHTYLQTTATTTTTNSPPYSQPPELLLAISRYVESMLGTFGLDTRSIVNIKSLDSIASRENVEGISLDGFIDTLVQFRAQVKQNVLQFNIKKTNNSNSNSEQQQQLQLQQQQLEEQNRNVRNKLLQLCDQLRDDQLPQFHIKVEVSQQPN